MHNKKIINPYFTIITVIKNDEKNIKKTIKSIKKQTYKNFEYIIVDGKSSDNTVKEILKFKKFINKFLSEKDKGIYYAMNKGVKISEGKIIVFVNSGDILFPNALRYVHKIFNDDSQIDFVFGTVKRNYTKKTILKYGFNKKRLLINFDFATAHSTGFFVKREEIIKVGSFNTKYKCSADYDLYFKLIVKNKLNGSFTKKNNIVGEVMSGGFSSRISFFDHLKEETRIRFDNGQNFLLIFIIFVNAILKELIKKIFS